MLIPFPVVGDYPGVPALLREAGGPSVSTLLNQFPGASALMAQVPGVSAFLSASPGASVRQLLSQVPGVRQLMAQAPGISALLKLPAFADVAGLDPVMTQDDPGATTSTPAPKWGIYDAGMNLVVEPDSFVSFEHSREWRISDFPVAPGAFASYNKVETPFEERITLAKGGTDQDRQTFLDALDTATDSINLYSVVTPGMTYVKVNVVGYDYRRQSSNGVTLLVAELRLRQVRESATSTFSNTVAPEGASAQNGGTVQSQTPTQAEQGASAAPGDWG
jgi:hypothetical protein